MLLAGRWLGPLETGSPPAHGAEGGTHPQRPPATSTWTLENTPPAWLDAPHTARPTALGGPGAGMVWRPRPRLHFWVHAFLAATLCRLQHAEERDAAREAVITASSTFSPAFTAAQVQIPWSQGPRPRPLTAIRLTPMLTPSGAMQQCEPQPAFEKEASVGNLRVGSLSRTG